jgi:hypothetical protein
VVTGEELRTRLLSGGVSGWVATPRSNSVDHLRRLAAGEPYFQLGLELGDRWTYERIAEVMAARCGTPVGGWDDDGPDWIDPDLTVAALDRLAAMLAGAVGRRVMLATGHPHGLLGLHLALARGLASAGAVVVAVPAALADEGVRVDQMCGVAMIHSGGSLRHTHSGRWMDLVLDALDAPPDLVVADHGWTGAAARRGIEAVGFADCNDPALFVGESEGTVELAVPLDDGLPYSAYEPVIAYLLESAFG